MKCGICDEEGRHEHHCALCGKRVTMKDADWRISTMTGIIEHFHCRKERS